MTLQQAQLGALRLKASTRCSRSRSVHPGDTKTDRRLSQSTTVFATADAGARAVLVGLGLSCRVVAQQLRCLTKRGVRVREATSRILHGAERLPHLGSVAGRNVAAAARCLECPTVEARRLDVGNNCLGAVARQPAVMPSLVIAARLEEMECQGRDFLLH